MSSLIVLALAGSALAIPFAEHHGHVHKHRHHFFSAGVTGTGNPYALANATGIYGATGTAASTGLPVASSYAYSPEVQVAAGSADSGSVDDPESTTCTQSTTYVTKTKQITITVQQTETETTTGTSAGSGSSLSTGSAVTNGFYGVANSTYGAGNSSYGAAHPTHGAAHATGGAVHSAVNVTDAANSTSFAPIYASSAAPSMTLDLRNKGFNNIKWHRKSTSVSTSASSSVVESSSSSASVAAASSTLSSSSSESTSVYVAPTSSVAASSSVAVASSTTSSSTASQSASSSNGKRGCAYNDATLCAAFESSSQVSWGYNWGQSSSGLSDSFNYVPMLWGTSSTFTSGWADSVKSSGATHLMSFNEPDLSSQSNISPEDAAAAYKTYMEPYAGTYKLGAPAVTNGANGMGLDWLSAFLSACDSCTIDFVSIHWYDSSSNSEYFKDHVSNATSVAGGKPVWVTEFGCTDGSDSDISSFLETVMPWMDEQDYVERYSYFMASDGILNSGSELSSLGSTFAS
ncbi:hypothetical protein AAFC00_001125 [Neodothiora populina]|uniref:Asl1-like glycosyl hydrolase catalytic domain-containing protein n=1 Tax=Neodothiora populina TaxID=2781224 RepID=A0ABR3PMY3_9PEZI